MSSQLTDEYISNKFFTKQNQINWARLKKASEEEINYIINRFKEKSRSIKEDLFRIKLGIEIIPKCPVCGKYCIFQNRIKRPYLYTCSKECGVILLQTKSKQTRLEKYGHPYWSNWEKTKKTVREKYGDKGVAGNPEIQQRIRQTNIERYGYPSTFSKNSPIRQKIEQIWIDKFGVDNPAKNNKIKNKIIKTNNERYGGNAPASSPLIKEKIKNTCLERYGETCTFKIKDIQEKSRSKEARLKSDESKRKNHTFNTSKSEDKTYVLLKEKFPSIKRNYKDKIKYPFNCDFYISELDLFIECNFHWTHGGKPFNLEDKECKDKLNKWKSKAETSQFYRNAINTWTIRDVNKREIAKKNNLNYIEFWNLNEIKTWLEMIK